VVLGKEHLDVGAQSQVELELALPAKDDANEERAPEPDHVRDVILPAKQISMYPTEFTLSIVAIIT
jgi:hypothetical protein